MFTAPGSANETKHIEPFRDSALTELLAAARVNNGRLGVTGMLLYHEGSFLQALEGDEDVLENLYAKIGKDKRHHRLVALDPTQR